jgi:hypothetical protein
MTAASCVFLETREANNAEGKDQHAVKDGVPGCHG